MHTAGERGLTMSADGWSSIEDVLRVLGMDRFALDQAVRDNDKQGLQVDGERIRACQGRSLAGMPVTCEALENSWERVYPDHLRWHGTRVDAQSVPRSGGTDCSQDGVHMFTWRRRRTVRSAGDRP